MTKLPKFNDSFLNNKHENKNNKEELNLAKLHVQCCCGHQFKSTRDTLISGLFALRRYGLKETKTIIICHINQPN